MIPDGTETIANEVSAQELEAVKKTLRSFTSLFKTYNLYPADHSISRNNLAKFIDELNSFLITYETLRLETRKNSFYYKDKKIFAGQAEENNPAYLLCRDGLEYIEFIRGIDPEEISAFIDLLIQYRNPFEAVEGDIVTALWQRSFQHILYQEVDIFTLESFEFDLTTFKITPEEPDVDGAAPEDGSHSSPLGHQTGKMEKGFLAAAELEKNKPLEQSESPSTRKPESISATDQNRFLTEEGSRLFELTADDQKTLTEYVQNEENKDFTSDAIDVMLVILATQTSRENFAYVLEFMEFEFFETMERRDFHLAFKLLNNLQIIRNQFSTSKNWCSELIDSFIDSISEKEKFKQIRWIRYNDFSWSQSPYITQLWKVLRMLAPRIILTLGPLMYSIPLSLEPIRNEMLKIIEFKGKQGPKELGLLLEESDRELNLLLAHTLHDIPKNKAAEIYLQMTHHGAAEVRKIGLDGYMMSVENPDFEKLFHLVGDKDSLVRKRVLTYYTIAGEQIAAKFLMRFLSDAPSADPLAQKIILSNYDALASCRSFDSLPFLEKKLMEGKLRDMFGNSTAIHKKGAALALKTIGTQNALSILEKGAKSLKPDIRSACREVLDI